MAAIPPNKTPENIYRFDDPLPPDWECSSCLSSDIKAGDSVCIHGNETKHIFHTSCLVHWVARYLNCPICREPIASPSDPQNIPHYVSDSPLIPKWLRVSVPWFILAMGKLSHSSTLTLIGASSDVMNGLYEIENSPANQSFFSKFTNYYRIVIMFVIARDAGINILGKRGS